VTQSLPPSPLTRLQTRGAARASNFRPWKSRGGACGSVLEGLYFAFRAGGA
jgi:hypothetical protein